MKQINAIKKITVGELRTLMLNQFKGLNDEDEVTFGGGALSFNRVKNRGPVAGPQLLDIEFNELFKVTYDPATEG